MAGILDNMAEYWVFAGATLLGLCLLQVYLPKVRENLRLPTEMWVFCVALLIAGYFAVEVVDSQARLARIACLGAIMVLAGVCVTVISVLKGDLMELRRVEEKLRRSEERLSLHFEQVPLAVIEFTPEGVVTAWNPEAEKIFGYTAKEVIGREFFEILLPESARESVRKVFRELTTLSGGTHNINENVTKSGRTIMCEWHNTPLINSQGKVIGITGVGHDITERLQLEEELRISQKIQSVGQLAAGIAHDFNNILTIIQGRADLLRSRVDLPSQAELDIDHIAMAAERAADLTRQLLTFSRRRVMFIAPINLNEVVSSVTAMLERTLSEAITLECNLAPNLPLIEADRGMISQLVMNLAINASDAMPEGGKLTLKTSLVKAKPPKGPRINGTHPEWNVRLDVCDSGIGMDPEQLGRVFEPFFTTKEVGKGPGLGLSVVHGIVQEHDGAIDVESSPGKGTTFSIFFPTKVTPVPELPEQTDHSPVILLVEDEAAVRRATARTLQNHGYQVFSAANAHEAQERWKELSHRIALIITDVVLPQGTSGRALIDAIQGTRTRIRCIFISGYRMEVALPDFTPGNGHYFLQKPFTPVELTEVVRTALADTPADLVLEAQSPA
ncbi:MAG: PAS domain S-box protein [Chthoniobacteraceae bacterium]